MGTSTLDARAFIANRCKNNPSKNRNAYKDLTALSPNMLQRTPQNPQEARTVESKTPQSLTANVSTKYSSVLFFEIMSARNRCNYIINMRRPSPSAAT